MDFLTDLDSLIVAPEERLLVAAVAATAGDGSDFRRVVPVVQAWPRVVELSAAHRVACLLQLQLREGGVLAALPAETQAQLAAAAQVEVAGGLVARRQLAEVSSALTQAEVSHTLLKGAALATAVYPPALPRPMSDLDLLLTPADLERGAAALTALGYREVPQPADGGHHRVFQQGPRLVELHWRLSDLPPFAFPPDETHAGWGAAQLPAETAARLPTPLEMLFQVAFHHVFVNRFYAGLQGLLDLALLWQQAPELFPDAAVLDYARRSRTSGLMYWTLAALHDWVGLEVSPPLLDALRPPAFALRWGRALLEGSFVGSLSHLGRRPDWPDGWSRWQWHVACSNARDPRVLLRTLILYGGKVSRRVTVKKGLP
jgi:hypothetical protein